MANQNSPEKNIWEQKVIREVLMEHVSEQRRKRRWSIFFKLIILLALVFIIFNAYIGPKYAPEKYAELEGDHIAKIEIKGVIAETNDTNAENVIEALNKAYEKPNVKAIVLDINSPGGTPVQARQIFNELRYLQEKYKDKKTYAVIGDMGTSAAYLIAAGANEIYADETSYVGSIGALVNSFGFVKALENLGIERRLYVSGEHKGMLDPFSPETDEHKEFIETSLDIVHKEFINNVQQGRGSKLKDNPDLFSGRFWTGKEALGLGLIDDFGDIYKLQRDVIKVNKIIDYTESDNIFERFSKKFSSKIKTSIRAMLFEPVVETR